MARPNLAQGPSVLLIVVALSVLMLTPVAAEEAGAEAGDVTVNMTLKGPVDDRDGFLIIIDCADEWCDDETVQPDWPDGKIVIFCGPDVADAPVCSADTYQFTVALLTGRMDYWFFRIAEYETARDSQGFPIRDQVLHLGTWDIHSASQAITLEYVYPGGDSHTGGSGPTLPDTALPAP